MASLLHSLATMGPHLVSLLHQDNSTGSSSPHLISLTSLHLSRFVRHVFPAGTSTTADPAAGDATASNSVAPAATGTRSKWGIGAGTRSGDVYGYSGIAVSVVFIIYILFFFPLQLFAKACVSYLQFVLENFRAAVTVLRMFSVISSCSCSPRWSSTRSLKGPPTPPKFCAGCKFY